jgi:hypothetical protein
MAHTLHELPVKLHKYMYNICFCLILGAIREAEHSGQSDKQSSEDGGGVGQLGTKTAGIMCVHATWL